jgi:hypothetical protein
MLAEIGWRCRGTGALEVVGRTQYQSLASTDAADCQRRIQHLSHPQRQIDALLHEVDLTVVEHDFQIEVPMLCEELRQQRNEVDTGEGNGGADAATVPLVRCLHRARRALLLRLPRSRAWHVRNNRVPLRSA